jgi:hypothetical protein
MPETQAPVGNQKAAFAIDLNRGFWGEPHYFFYYTNDQADSSFRMPNLREYRLFNGAAEFYNGRNVSRYTQGAKAYYYNYDGQSVFNQVSAFIPMPEDAIFAEIYPDVIQSKNFIAELMTIPVKTQEDNQTCSYYVYLRDRQKNPWWDSLTGKLRNWLKPSPKDSYEGKEKLSVFSLTKQQEDIFFSVQDKLKCTVNKKTNVVTITFKDQDPLVCATMADSTCQKLQDFIINYRTNKARVDYEYYKKLCDKSKLEYEQALHQYAASADAHTNAVMATYQSQVERLENNMQIKYNVYTSMQAQLQAATAKLQETTPAFTVIESATIPHKPAGPKRVLIAIVVTILAFLVMTGWQLLKSRDITQ